MSSTLLNTQESDCCFCFCEVGKPSSEAGVNEEGVAPRREDDQVGSADKVQVG